MNDRDLTFEFYRKLSANKLLHLFQLFGNFIRSLRLSAFRSHHKKKKNGCHAVKKKKKDKEIKVKTKLNRMKLVCVDGHPCELNTHRRLQ